MQQHFPVVIICQAGVTCSVCHIMDSTGCLNFLQERQPKGEKKKKENERIYLPTHHPHHEVGEDSDPDSGEDEGEHEVLLPAWLGTVGDGEEKQQQQGP